VPRTGYTTRLNSDGLTAQLPNPPGDNRVESSEVDRIFRDANHPITVPGPPISLHRFQMPALPPIAVSLHSEALA
jgi:hypothetical protein